jgi:hypothetical protein
VLTAAVLALVGLGCAGSDDDQGASLPVTTTTTATAPTTTEESFEGGTGTVTAPAETNETALLERVAVAGHDSYDRVVFQFRNGVPGYRVEYVEPPLREDGSGNVVNLDGAAFLVVRMEPASGFDLSVPEGAMVYTGPRRISPEGTSVVREVVRTGDFEAVLTWAIGLNEQVPFRVLTLDDPARIVVDFAVP